MVSEEEIKKFNTELSQKSVYPGMVLRIPDLGNASKIQTTQESDQYLSHLVLPKENLFSISRQYGIKVDEIRELNPDAKWGLKTGQVLRIPKERITIAQKTQARNEMKVKELTGDSVKAPESPAAGQPCRLKPFPHDNDNFRLSILLPLNISQNDTLTYSDTLRPEHFRFYEFLEGVYLAIDSMRLEGLNLTVEVFDTGKDPEIIKELINDHKLDEADLIIGPVFPNEIAVVSAFSKGKHIPMVSPFSSFDVISNNPYAFQVRNNLTRQIELAIDYMGSKFNQNVLVIGRFSEKSSPDFTRFLANLGQQIKGRDPSEKISIKTVYYSETARSFMNTDSQAIKIGSFLSASKSNYLILPSENEVFITEVINELYQQSNSYQIQVFGLNQWVFKDLDLGNLYNVNLEVYSDFDDDEPFVDFADPAVLNFCLKYKDNWNIEPSKYSFQGFDIAYFFTRALFRFGRNLTASVPCWPEYLNHASMLTPMRFQCGGDNYGYDNHAIMIVRYQKDELVRKKVN